MKTIAELTAGGRNVDSVVDDLLGAGTRSEEAASAAHSTETEHVASAADAQQDFMGTTPGFPEYLEKFADACDDICNQLDELPKEASLTGDLRMELAPSPVAETHPEVLAAAALVDRVLGATGGAQ